MKSTNRLILKKFSQKIKDLKIPPNINYIIIYTFLYKFCSDHLKDHFLMLIEDEEVTLDEAYKSFKYRNVFRQDAMNLFGYYIKSPDAFFDEVINNDSLNDFFLTNFFKKFSENIIFDDESNDKIYFEFLFNTINEEVPIAKYELEKEYNSSIKEIILLISRFNIFEEDLKFQDLFDLFLSSTLFDSASNHYISQIFPAIISSQKNYVGSVYNPFIGDASSIINLSKSCPLGLEKCFGKEENKLFYCYSVVRLFINYFNLNSIFINNDNAFKSVDMKTSFDVILSDIPKYDDSFDSLIKNQRLEILKRKKYDELKEILIKDFNINDSAENNRQLDIALENLVNSIDFEINNDMQFSGEYESLNNTKCLFLINLIETLKKDGIMVISIFDNLLYDKSFKLLRKYLTYEKNYIDTIITLPSASNKTKKQKSIIIFKKDRVTRDILFVDFLNDYNKELSYNYLSGFSKKKYSINDESLDKLCEVFSYKLSVDNYSRIVGLDEVIDNDFNLSVSKYVNSNEKDFISLYELKKQKEEIDNNTEKLNNKINGLMDELGINF